MRIALVRRGYSNSGGAERYLLRLAEGLIRHGHTPELVTGSDWPDEAWPHGQIVRLPAHSPIAFANTLRKRQQSAGWDRLFSLERVWQCHAYRAGDGVHAAWLARRRAFEPAWRGWLRHWHPKHRALLRLEKSLFSNGGAEQIIVNAPFVAEEMKAYYGLDPAKVHVVANGYDPGPRLPPDQRRELAHRFRHEHGLAADTPLALFVGSGWERKGLATALAAMDQCGDEQARLIVAGHDRHARRYQHPRALFLGPVADPVPLFNACDAFILPTYYDPFSNACLEAAAHGLPVITTDANGFSSLLGSLRFGQVVPAGDIATTALALSLWFEHPASDNERAAIANHARQFSTERNVTATLRTLGWERR